LQSVVRRVFRDAQEVGDPEPEREATQQVHRKTSRVLKRSLLVERPKRRSIEVVGVRRKGVAGSRSDAGDGVAQRGDEKVIVLKHCVEANQGFDGQALCFRVIGA